MCRLNEADDYPFKHLKFTLRQTIQLTFLKYTQQF